MILSEDEIRDNGHVVCLNGLQVVRKYEPTKIELGVVIWAKAQDVF
jgi:hypothetical protein